MSISIYSNILLSKIPTKSEENISEMSLKSVQAPATANAPMMKKNIENFRAMDNAADTSLNKDVAPTIA
jgi:hypothetical protein